MLGKYEQNRLDFQPTEYGIAAHKISRPLLDQDQDPLFEKLGIIVDQSAETNNCNKISNNFTILTTLNDGM